MLEMVCYPIAEALTHTSNADKESILFRFVDEFAFDVFLIMFKIAEVVNKYGTVTNSFPIRLIRN